MNKHFNIFENLTVTINSANKILIGMFIFIVILMILNAKFGKRRRKR